MKIRAKNGEQTVDITLPATDMDIQYCMKCIGIEDIVPVCCISEVWDELSYFGFLKGQTVNMDELNFFARRLDGMTEYEKRVVGVYSSETGMREIKQLINLTYSLQGLSLITDLTDGNRVGLRLYLDQHLAISEEEKSRMDFNAYAQKIFSEGKCKFLPHGILVDQGFHMEEVYNGKTFPEYIDRPDETVAVLSLGNEAGDKDYLYLPTDISAITTAYLRSEDILTSVEENLEYLNPPVKTVFADFVSRIRLIDPDLEAALEELKGKIENDVFMEWVDALKSCLYDRSLKTTLTPIVVKLSDMRIVNAELEYLVFEPRKEFITMVVLAVGNIPLLYFLNQSWYDTLMHTIPGQIMLAVTGAIIFVSTACVIKLTKPIEYRT